MPDRAFGQNDNATGTLHVVATPIGNLEDITLRALRVLREVPLIAAEDTRRTNKLLTHYGIPTRILSFHEHNTRARLPQLIVRLENGDDIALVSDAGTPGISDPGLELIQACIQRGIPVDPVPGASAVLAALVASGFPMERMTFYGFPPNRGNARKTWFEALRIDSGTIVIFESPHRIGATLEEIGLVLGNRPIMVARELTKLHQEFIRGTAADVRAALGEAKGELTLVVSPNKAPSADTRSMSSQEVAAEFGRLTQVSGLTRRQAISALAKKHGYRATVVFSMLEEAKKCGE